MSNRDDRGYRFLNLGFGNSVMVNRVIAVLNPDSSPMKRLREEARDAKRLIDVTHGRKTRSIIITDSYHVILSAIQTDTIVQRLSSSFENEARRRDE